MASEQTALDSRDLSSEYFERALRVTPGGVHSPVRAFKGVGGTPIFFRSAQGGTMTSVDGREYIDFCQSFGPLMLGHRDPDVAEAVREAIATATAVGAYLSDSDGDFSNLQAENDFAEPLVEDGHDTGEIVEGQAS